MLTLLLYVLIVGLVAALLFLLASALFGRSEELGPLPEGTTATVLPVTGINGSDVRALRFQQVFRGYKAGEVDWALARLAGRIDELETELADARAYVAATAPERPLAAANLTKATPGRTEANPDGIAATPGRIESTPDLTQATADRSEAAPDLSQAAANRGAADGDGAAGAKPRRVSGSAPLPRVLPGGPAAGDTPEAGPGTITAAGADTGPVPGAQGEGPAGDSNGEAGAR